MATRTRATVEDVLRLGAQGERYELVDGELVPMSPTGKRHGSIEAYVTWVLNTYVLPRQLGMIVSGEVLFELEPDGRLDRAPDVAFIARERWLAESDHPGAFVGAPDLAVEVVSPSDRAGEVERRVGDCLSHGTLAVLLMYPETRSVVLRRANTALHLGGDEEIDLGPALPGFRAKVSELFPPPLEPGERVGTDDPEDGGSR